MAQAQQERQFTGQADAVVRDDRRAGLVGCEYSSVADGVTGVDAAGEFMRPRPIAALVQDLGKVNEELGVAGQAMALRWASPPASPVDGRGGLRSQFPELVFAGSLPGPQQEGANS